MRMLVKTGFFVVVLLTGPAATTWAADLGSQAMAILQAHCVRCHGKETRKVEGLDFTDHGRFVSSEEQWVVPGNLDDSVLWIMVQEDEMPPGDPSKVKKLTAAEKKTLSDWITAGAPSFEVAVVNRSFVQEIEVQRAIRDHLRGARPSWRKHMRYFTLTHLHNNHTISDERLALFQAAFSKMINSLTWRSDIIVPQAVDAQATVFAVNLLDLKWSDQQHWSKILPGYPYAMEFDQTVELRELDREIRQLSTQSLARIRLRADWFVAKASRPPLYHELLELPDTTQALEQKLEVTSQEDFRNSDLVRGAVTKSGISNHNRLLDRHRSLHGYYWKSYDFGTDTGKANLRQNPLGPVFDNNPFKDNEAFVHAGGEIIFSLPNRLQGYLLVDENERRIDEGPINIVRDANETSGTSVIVNGLSCVACHKNGMIRFRDEIGRTAAVSAAAREKVQELFVSQPAIEATLQQDEDRFLGALLQAVGPFLKVTTKEELRLAAVEPVGVLARHYHADLTLEAVAAELEYDDPQKLLQDINSFPRKQILGSLLTPGGVVKRGEWEGFGGYHAACIEFEQGIPKRIR